MAVQFSNKSYLSQYVSPYLSDAVDEVTGRDYLERKLSSFVNEAVLEDVLTLNIYRHKLFSDPCNEQLKIDVGDGVVLGGVRIHAKQQPAKGAIFLALGSGECYEKIAEPQDLAYQFVDFFKSHVGNDIDIFVVNPRGIGKSKGDPSYRAWTMDMRHGLLEVLKHHSSKNILVYGHSAGAWLASDALKSFVDISFVADRTFCNFADMAYYYFGGGVKGTAAYALATFAKWNANVVDNYDANFKNSFMIHSHKDQTVHKEASLFTGIVRKGSFTTHLSEDKNYKCFALEESPSKVHTRAFTQTEKAVLGPQLRKMMKLD